MKKTAANDDNYFVFEDTMHQVYITVKYWLIMSVTQYIYMLNLYIQAHTHRKCALSCLYMTLFFLFLFIYPQVLLCFLHDNSLQPHYRHLSITPMKAYLKGKQVHLYIIHMLSPVNHFIYHSLSKMFTCRKCWGSRLSDCLSSKWYKIQSFGP